MADGRIGNWQLLQRAANFLNLEGVKRFPPILDTGDVKAVYILGGALNESVCSLARYNHNDGQGQSISAVGAYELPLIGPDFNPLMGSTLNGPAEIAQLSVRVLYDGPGSTADAGTILGLNLSRNAKYGSMDKVQCVSLDGWQNVAANQNMYAWSLGNYIYHGTSAARPSGIVNGDMGSRLIPQGDGLNLNVYRTAGGVWPTNTFIVVEMTVFTADCMPQLAWVPPS